MRKETISMHYGNERTVYMTDVPTILTGYFLKEKEPHNKPPTLVVADDERTDDALKDLLVNQEVIRVKTADLHEHLVSFALGELGANMKKRKIYNYNMTVEKAVKIEVSANLLETDAKKIKKANKGPALYFYRFGNFKVKKGTKTLVAAKASLTGPYLGDKNVDLALKKRQVEFEVEEEMRQDKKPNFSDARKTLAILFP